MILNKNVLCNGILYTKWQEVDQDDDNIDVLYTEGHVDGELTPEKPLTKAELKALEKAEEVAKKLAEEEALLNANK